MMSDLGEPGGVLSSFPARKETVLAPVVVHGEEEKEGTVAINATGLPDTQQLNAKHIVYHLHHNPPQWEQLVAALFSLGLVVLGVFGVQRLSVYWSKDTSKYYNSNYVTGDNIDNIIVHATLGFVTFLLVPIWIAVAFFLPDNRCYAIGITTILSAAGMLGTFGTVVLISDTVISAQSGTAVTATAIVWAIWWVATCILSGIAYCRKKAVGRRGAWAWWVRFMGMTVFGFALLPIFYSLSGNLAGSAVALISLFVVCVLLSEWIVWRGVVGSSTA